MDTSTYSTATESVTVASTTADAAATVVFTCPANHNATIDLLHIANNNNSSKKVYVQFFHEENTTYHYIIKNHAVAGNSAQNLFNAAPMHLHAGDKIVAYGETTNTIEALISCKVFYNPNR